MKLNHKIPNINDDSHVANCPYKKGRTYYMFTSYQMNLEK